MYVIGDEQAIPQKVVDQLTKAGVITRLAPLPPTTVPASTTLPMATTATTLAPTPTANRADVIRITGATPADVGRAVAAALDLRTDEEKSRSVPAFAGAVAVNPASKEASAGIAFAAGLRYPVVFVDRDGVPAPTADTFNAMAVQNTWVVGGPDAVSDGTMAALPGAKRLGGADVAATSAAVANEVKARGLPVNLVYVADESRPVDAAVGAAAISRLGGLLLLTPGAGTGAAERQIDQLGLASQVDRIVVGESVGESNVPWPLIIASAVLAVVGVFLIDRAARKSRERPDAAPTPTVGTGVASEHADRQP